MKALGGRPQGLRLERMQSSPLWAGEGFRNVHPVLAGLRDPAAKPPTLAEFLCDEGRRIPANPLPSEDPRDAWSRRPRTGLRATWLGL